MRSKSEELMLRIREYIESYFERYSSTPTVREIAGAMKIAVSSAHRYLVAMAEKDMVSYEDGVLSTPKIKRMNPAVSPAAIVGSIPCGSPEEKEAQVEEYLPLSVSFFGKGDFYALRASGSSMTGAQIDDGDLVIIRQQHTAQVGEIVVALTDEDKNTLKRLLYDDDRQSYYLHPENKDMEDIYVSGLRTADKLRIKQMANAMGVSFSAFLIRLRELGCLCYRPLSEYITEEMGLGQDGGAG